MFKFLHAADVHLDSPLKGLERYDGAPTEEFRRATRRALENLVGLAIEEKVAFAVIAGDLYDGDWHDHGTGLYLNAQMARLRDAGIKVYLIQGNHDAASQITKHLSLTDNVRRLSTERPETVHDEDHGVAIHGQGFATRSIKDNIALTYPPRAANYFNIGLLHTSATGRDGHDVYAPCAVEHLRSKAYDYWALGHIHKREALHDDPPILFPGNLQGRHARETGPKGCTLVHVDNGRVQKMEARALDVLRWEHCRIDANGSLDLDDLLLRISEHLERLVREADDRFLAVRIEVSGSCPAHDELASAQEGWVAHVRDRARDVGAGRVWVEKVLLRTTAPRRLDSGNGPIGTLAQYLDELRTDDDRLLLLASQELADLRRKLPAELREGSDALDFDSPARLREVLDQIGPLIARGLFVAGDGP